MKTANHTHHTRERMSTPQSPTNRAKRRAELRKARKSQAAGMAHDPRAVKFNAKRV